MPPDNITDNIIRFLDYIKQSVGEAATAITPTASHFYEVMVRQQFVVGLSYMGWSLYHLIMATLTIMAARFFWKKRKDASTFWDEPPDATESQKSDTFVANFFSGWTMIAIAGCIIFFFTIGHLGQAFNDGSEGLKRLLNPEFYVLQDIANFIRQQK